MESVSYKNKQLNYDRDFIEKKLKNNIWCALDDYICFLEMKQSLQKHSFDKYKLQIDIDELKSLQNKYHVSRCLNEVNYCQTKEQKVNNILVKSSIRLVRKKIK